MRTNALVMQDTRVYGMLLLCSALCLHDCLGFCCTFEAFLVGRTIRELLISWTIETSLS